MSYTLYEPTADTDIVAIYAHGELKSLIDSLGANLKYYGPHGESILTSITEAHSRGEPGHGPEMPNSTKWVNYKLTQIDQLGSGSELQQTAEDLGWAIAAITGETDTTTVVGALSGYSKIYGVHCRVGYSLGPVQEVARADLNLAANGWQDLDFEQITAATTLAPGTVIIDSGSKAHFVVEAGDPVKIQQRVDSRG